MRRSGRARVSAVCGRQAGKNSQAMRRICAAGNFENAIRTDGATGPSTPCQAAMTRLMANPVKPNVKLNAKLNVKLRAEVVSLRT